MYLNLRLPTYVKLLLWMKIFLNSKETDRRCLSIMRKSQWTRTGHARSRSRTSYRSSVEDFGFD